MSCKNLNRTLLLPVQDSLLAYLSGLISLPGSHPLLSLTGSLGWKVPSCFVTTPLLCKYYHLPLTYNSYPSFKFQPKCFLLETDFPDTPEGIITPPLCVLKYPAQSVHLSQLECTWSSSYRMLLFPVRSQTPLSHKTTYLSFLLYL